jgi:hypothetical protein
MLPSACAHRKPSPGQSPARAWCRPCGGGPCGGGPGGRHAEVTQALAGSVGRDTLRLSPGSSFVGVQPARELDSTTRTALSVAASSSPGTSTWPATTPAPQSTHPRAPLVSVPLPPWTRRGGAMAGQAATPIEARAHHAPRKVQRRLAFHTAHQRQQHRLVVQRDF